MIPKLFDAAATSWDTEGLGRLTDALSMSVKEKLNGEYTLSMEYPADGVNMDGIVAGAQIVVDPSIGHDPEPFDIKAINTAASDGIFKISAQHISYRLNKYTTMPFTASNPQAALSGLGSHAAQACPFNFQTNRSGTGQYKQLVPASIRSRLGGVSGSILDVYGGDYEFTKFDVKLWSRRGDDHGVEIRYGKNLIDVNQEKSIANTLTGIVPFWSKEVDGEIQTVTLPEKVLLASTAGNYPYPLTRPVDFSNDFDEKPTEAQLRARGQRYLDDNVTGIPDVNIKVSFINLADTEQYANIAPLETVQLGDTVRVYFEQLDILATARVIEIDYDPLRWRYNSVTIGNVKNTISDIIVQNTRSLDELRASVRNDMAGQYTALQQAIDTATQAITGQLGGHLRFGLGADGEPNEMYIMDTTDVNTAVKVWRYNLAGWGVSNNGIGGPYTMAATLESGLVADFVTAGTMLADRIRGGTLELGGDNNVNGVLVVKDANGNTVTTIDKDGASITGVLYNILNGAYVRINQGRYTVGDLTHGESGSISADWWQTGVDQFVGLLWLEGADGIVLAADEIYTRESAGVNMQGGSGSLVINGATITFQNGLMITDIT